MYKIVVRRRRRRHRHRRTLNRNTSRWGGGQKSGGVVGRFSCVVVALI